MALFGKKKKSTEYLSVGGDFGARHASDALAVYAKYSKMFRGNKKVVLGLMQRVCPGGKHAWFESSVGLIRKPINQ